MLKKVLIGLLAAMLVAVPLVGCGGGNAETTSTATVEENADEWVKDILDEEFNVWWKIPANWTKKDVSDSMTQYFYYPDEVPESRSDTTNVVDVKIFKIDNEIYTDAQAEHYINLFIEDVYGKGEGYENVKYHISYTSGDQITFFEVPAMRCTFDAGDGTFSVNAYCFLYDEDRVLTIEYWHKKDAENDYTEEFEAMIKNLIFRSMEPIRYNAETEVESEENTKKVAPAIGMTKEQVHNSVWGTPDDKNIDEYAWGVHEQWVYDDRGYIYFEDGIVTAIQHRD